MKKSFIACLACFITVLTSCYKEKGCVPDNSYNGITVTSGSQQSGYQLEGPHGKLSFLVSFWITTTGATTYVPSVAQSVGPHRGGSAASTIEYELEEEKTGLDTEESTAVLYYGGADRLRPGKNGNYALPSHGKYHFSLIVTYSPKNKGTYRIHLARVCANLNDSSTGYSIQIDDLATPEFYSPWMQAPYN